MSNTIAGEGTLLQFKNSTFVTVGRVEEIDGPEGKVTSVKKTHTASTIQEYRPGKKPDMGTLTFKFQLDPADTVHAILKGRVDTPGTVDDWKLIYNDGQTTPASSTFSGFVTKYKQTGMGADEKNLMGELEVQLTTVTTFVAGTP